MAFEDINLPSNRKFGFMFTIIFALFSLYFFYVDLFILFTLFLIFCSAFFLLSYFDSDLLSPLNRLWMRFGYLLSLIVNPIILGIIFFILLTPLALSLRLFGRDELHLRKSSSVSHWRIRESFASVKERFRSQF